MAGDDDEVLVSGNAEPEHPRRYGVATDMHTVRSRDKLRTQMQTDVERFLNSGGRIEHLPSHATGELIGVRADQ